MSRTQEQIAVMQASLEERKIEYRATSADHKPVSWLPCNAPSWDWANYEYRVAPEPAEPRVVWIAMNGNRVGSVLELGTNTDAESMGYTRFTEIPPGWKLVPPVAGRPLPEGVPPLIGKFADFDYWGTHRLKVRAASDEDKEDVAVFFDNLNGDKWETGFCGDSSGGHGHKAIRRNTALHAANFGEVKP